MAVDLRIHNLASRITTSPYVATKQSRCIISVMEPSLSLSHKSKKRKVNYSTTQEEVKRLKTELKNDDLAKHHCHPASISVQPSHLQESITPKELTELLQFAALGKTYGVKKPSWCRLRHQKKVKGVNVVVLEGLTQSHFYKHYLSLRHLSTNYSTRLSFTPSSSNLASEIFASKVPGLQNSSVSQRNQESSPLDGALKYHPIIRRFGAETKGLTAYTVKKEDMIKKCFPVKGMPGFEGFVCTDSDDCVTDSSPLYGLDCEMCITEKGYELARVSLVDSSGNCMMDNLVKPQNRILNYLTRFSGITAAMLGPVTTTLREIQTKLKMLLPQDAVLVGHSLENDLRALNLIHPHVIDTSLLYCKEFGQKFKLKVLAEAILKKQIQIEEKLGHNPTEDAVATLELAQYFIKMGPRRVVELHLEELWGWGPVLYKSAASGPLPTQSNRFADVLQRSGQSATFIGKRADVMLDLSHQQWYNSDREVLSSFRNKTTVPSFSVLQFSSFSDHLRTFPCQEHHYQKMYAHLRDMCVVFAGPFPAGFSDKDVRRLFRCCGPVRKIQILNTSLIRIHAKIEFELLEGAELALKTLNGLNASGYNIKVQRPVNDSMLDLDLTLHALMEDPLNANLIYAVSLKPMSSHTHVSPKASGHTLDARCSAATATKMACYLRPSEVNGSSVDASYSELPVTGTGLNVVKQLYATTCGLSEEELRDAFGRFGMVKKIILLKKSSKKRARHAYIKFETLESTHMALSYSEELANERYLICPAMTPSHLSSWVTSTFPMTTMNSEGEATTEENRWPLQDTNPQDHETERIMRKLDRRMGKLFRSLPESTLSVVVVPGLISSHGHLPGLCFMEVK
ncbi:RNA exonuclease 5-like [Lampris incognitus]|uniref:RNA exonuclease 5-like n=1 Tax=Lampris incognitus TaxID=2546036 RepID=UPI0024B4FDF4|nr:RNA exonuclease 5-like [Lampris incognitus]